MMTARTDHTTHPAVALTVNEESVWYLYAEAVRDNGQYWNRTGSEIHITSFLSPRLMRAAVNGLQRKGYIDSVGRLFVWPADVVAEQS